MFYIVTEDLKSSYDFWVSFNKLILDNKVKVITTNGVGEIGRTIRNININRDNKVILALDKIDNFSLTSELGKVEEQSTRKGFQLVISELYCIEEIFLSFPKLLEWCKTSKHIEVVNFIRESLFKDKSYRPRMKADDWEPVIQKYVDKKARGTEGDNLKNKRLNREQLAASVLAEVTYKTPFDSSNKEYSDCWHVDCCKDVIDIESYYDKNYLMPRCTLVDEMMEGSIIKGKCKLEKLIFTSILPRRLDIDKIIKESFKEKYSMIYYKDLLIKKKITMGKILDIHKEMKDKEGVMIYEYGDDIYEQVYNFKYGETREKQREEDRIGGIKGF